MFSNLSGIDIAYIVISLLIGMIIHEVMHGVTARALGDSTAADMGRLTLNPLKHIDVLTTLILPIVLISLGAPPIMAAKPVPFNPDRVKWGEYGAALVGLAGPVTNFVLALIAAIALHAITNVQLGTFLVFFIQVNVLLTVFNLIPIPPLDGSRVLYAFAPEPIQEIMARIERMGFLVILFMLLIIYQFVAAPIEHVESVVYNFLLTI